MSKFSIVDSHVHLLDTSNLSYPFFSSNPNFNNKYLPSDYSEHIEDINVEKIVFLEFNVSPDQALDEAKWIESLSMEDSRIQSVVAYASLENGEKSTADLEKLSNVNIVKGIRRNIFPENDEFHVRKNFISGVNLLPKYNFSFDICISDFHLPGTIELVKSCPNVSFILDHIGNPNIIGNEFENWSKNITDLSKLPNIACKLSGVVTNANHKNWNVEDIRPYILHVVESFGFDRILFGSDWPVVTLASSYKRWFDSLNHILGNISQNEKQKLFVKNAEKFYKM